MVPVASWPWRLVARLVRRSSKAERWVMRSRVVAVAVEDRIVVVEVARLERGLLDMAVLVVGIADVDSPTCLSRRTTSWCLYRS